MRRPNARLLSLYALKGHNFVQKPYRVMPLGQIAALVMVNVHWLSYNQHTFQTIDTPVINTQSILHTYKGA